LSRDIGPLLAGWEFEPDRIQVRIITTSTGSEKIQMRIDLGLMQMEMDGRPDGVQPDGFESLLELYEAKAAEAESAAESFKLDAADCSKLLREGLQYYHRYLAAFQLERFSIVARDTARNLRLFAFVHKHAASQRDRIEFDQYRPYVTLMHARASATESLNQGEHRTALAQIDHAIDAIRAFLTEYNQEDRQNECSELQFLLRWRREVEHNRPLGLAEQLEQQLKLAVELEDYEEAARLRDQIRRLTDGEPIAL
jgi:UvrB/uvrC motif